MDLSEIVWLQIFFVSGNFKGPFKNISLFFLTQIAKFTTCLVIIILECQLLDFNHYSQVIKHTMSFENWLRVILD